jgi:hypothetical protein
VVLGLTVFLFFIRFEGYFSLRLAVFEARLMTPTVIANDVCGLFRAGAPALPKPWDDWWAHQDSNLGPAD